MSYYNENTQRALDTVLNINLDNINTINLSQIIKDTYIEKDRLLSSIDSKALESFSQILTIYCDSKLNLNKKKKKQNTEEYVNGISNTALVMKTHLLNKNIHKRRSFSRDHAICFCYAAGMNDTEADSAIRKLFGHHSFHKRDYRDLIFSFFLKTNTAANCVENYSAAVNMIEKFMPEYEQLECTYELDSRAGHENDLTNYFCERSEDFESIKDLTDFLESEDTKYETGKTNRTLLTAFYISISKIIREIIIGITADDEFDYDMAEIKKIYSDNKNNPKAIFTEMLSLLNSSLDPYYRYLKKGALPHCRSAFTVWKNMYNYACDYFDDEISNADYILETLSYFKESERQRVLRAIKKTFLINVFTLSYYGGQFSIKKEYHSIVNFKSETNASEINLDEHYEDETYNHEVWIRNGRKEFNQPVQEELFPKKFADTNIDYIDKGCVPEDLAMATDIIKTIQPPSKLNTSDKDKREKDIDKWIQHAIYQKSHICKKVSCISELITLAAEVFNNVDNLTEFDINASDIDTNYLEKLSTKYEKLSNENIIPSDVVCDRDILMFTFYISATISAFEKREKRKKDSLSDFEEIDWNSVVAEINMNLSKCGLSQLDPYNPLDYLIILSINSESPFMYVQGVLDSVRDYLISKARELQKSEKEHGNL